MNQSMTYQQRIREKLTAAFQPSRLEIHDDSARHAGHAGHNPAGETHFIVTVVSPAFEGLRTLDRHRRVYEVLADEIKEHVHALSLHTMTPDEAAAKYNQ